jgi:hypothetical protein
LTTNNFSLGGYVYDETDPRIGKGVGYYTNDFSRVSSIRVIDTPIDTYAIVKSAGNLEKYCLRGIDWIITDTDTQYCMRPNSNDLTAEQIYSYYIYNSTTKTYEQWKQNTYPTTVGTYLYEKMDMVVDNKITCIPVLDYLMTKQFLDSTKHSEALTGTITLDLNGVTANELAIYKRYVDTYPNVEIKYGDNVTVEGAHRINFYYTDVDTVGPNGNVDNISPYFSVLTANGEATLAELINTPEFNNPNKGATATQVFTFFGLWKDLVTNKDYYYPIDGVTIPDQYIAKVSAAALFEDTIPAGSMKLIPYFMASDRVYTFTFYNDTYPADEAILFTL